MTSWPTYPILGKIHVGSENVCASAMHLLSQKVLVQRTLSLGVVLQGDVPVCAESTRQHCDIPKYALQRFIQDIGHLVLEVLCCNKRIQEVLSILALECHNLSASTADVGIDIKCFPEMVYGSGSGHRSNVEQYTDIGLEDGPKSVEEPAV